MNVEWVMAIGLLHWKSFKDDVLMMQTNVTPDIDHSQSRSPPNQFSFIATVFLNLLQLNFSEVGQLIAFIF